MLEYGDIIVTDVVDYTIIITNDKPRKYNLLNLHSLMLNSELETENIDELLEFVKNNHRGYDLVPYNLVNISYPGC